MSREDEINRLIDLVKFDYEHSLKLIDGVVRVSLGLRTIAFAGCLALLTAAMQTDQPVLALFALATAVVFGFQDAYHGWLYAEARKRVKAMERLLDDYYRLLQGEGSPARRTQLLKNLRRHRIGFRVSRQAPSPPDSRIRETEWRGETSALFRIASRFRAARSWLALQTLLREARPRVVYLLLYPFLLVISVVGLVAVGVSDGESAEGRRPVRVCIACGSDPGAENLSGSAPDLHRSGED